MAAGPVHAVVVEDLNTNAMIASAKGAVEEPGTNMKAKAGLNRSIPAKGVLVGEPCVP